MSEQLKVPTMAELHAHARYMDHVISSQGFEKEAELKEHFLHNA